MCTVSWLRRVDGYLLLCNRDERRTRKVASGPRLHRGALGSYVAPVDGDAGGTWIAANDSGVALCLLNDYLAPLPPAGHVTTSRGLLVADLAAERDLESALRRLDGVDLRTLHGFVLLMLGPGAGETAIARWNTAHLRVERGEPARPLLVSSGWQTARVIAAREELFDVALGDAGDGREVRQRAFHTSHAPLRGPLSPCMHRDDASTVSASRVDVHPREVVFAYQPGAPCEVREDEVVRLPRAGLR